MTGMKIIRLVLGFVVSIIGIIISFWGILQRNLLSREFLGDLLDTYNLGNLPQTVLDSLKSQSFYATNTLIAMLGFIIFLSAFIGTMYVAFGLKYYD